MVPHTLHAHAVSNHVPKTPNLTRLLDIMARLRNPEGGCPWDLEQTFETIAPHTIEEAYEVADAIQQEDPEALRDELGDLLFQVVFHARMAEDEGLFDFDDVARTIADKMVRRHPHVFADQSVDSAAAQTVAWEDHKAAERARKTEDLPGAPSALDDIVLGLPALTRAVKLQRRAARVGFDWPDLLPIFSKIDEELSKIKAELPTDGSPSRDRVEDEVGDLLFVAVNLARRLDVDPEAALRRANTKFERRFRSIEAGLAAQGKDPSSASLDEMEALWQDAKKVEKGDQK
jgi:ATP diphosphatase